MRSVCGIIPHPRVRHIRPTASDGSSDDDRRSRPPGIGGCVAHPGTPSTDPPPCGLTSFPRNQDGDRGMPWGRGPVGTPHRIVARRGAVAVRRRRNARRACRTLHPVRSAWASPHAERTVPIVMDPDPDRQPTRTVFRAVQAVWSPVPRTDGRPRRSIPPLTGMERGGMLPGRVTVTLAVPAVLPRIIMYFTPKGEPHDGLLPASSTHSS